MYLADFALLSLWLGVLAYVATCWACWACLVLPAHASKSNTCCWPTSVCMHAAPQRLSPRELKANCSLWRQTLISANTSWPSSQHWPKSMPPHWSYLTSVPLPLFISRRLYQCYLSCLTDFGVVSRPTHLGQGRGASVEDGGSECKQSLSLNRQPGSSAICVCVWGPGPQDKNVFDIVCNCVMFTLLISEGACISKQAFDCRPWWGRGIPFPIHWETTRSLDAGLGEGT